MSYLVKTQVHYLFPLLMNVNQSSTYFKLSYLIEDGKSFPGTYNKIYQNLTLIIKLTRN